MPCAEPNSVNVTMIREREHVVDFLPTSVRADRPLTFISTMSGPVITFDHDGDPAGKPSRRAGQRSIVNLVTTAWDRGADPLRSGNL